MSYILSRPASEDIDEILDYVAAQSVQNAVLVARHFEKAFARITEMPNIGHPRDELKDDNARVLSVSGYLVIYDATHSPIQILRVVRAVRDLNRIQSRPE
jgi:plasmid stabilization system protein ParE